ncbi:UPF0716 protein FxsA [Salsuginibacillus halophilus]|uniref:UPF0716 protein FxsA n=1 Tax=Salsuginibacillus halophilus TaxID=517424 RepID=A0A2P8HCV8_9BACI|nr:FxsA family protein [Salsuginibacillus halophilus]PSL44074.1 UPF0716 protein FxsA [Salsuginibacillus halophilus]
MGRILLLLLLVVPTVEMIILVAFGQWIGFWPTVAMVVLTGVLGAWLTKREGMQTIRTAQLQMQQGEVPQGLIMDGLCILVGGVVLLTPGFITDVIGFILLLPPTRGYIKAALQRVFQKMIQSGQIIIRRP